jgi:hypothetical protein
VNISLPTITNTPVGAAVQAGTIASIIVGVLESNWPWFAHEPATVQTGAAAVFTAVLAYLGAWLKLVLTPGQKTTLSLTSSPLPTVQGSIPAPAPPAAGP